jgi:hypothetical protein
MIRTVLLGNVCACDGAAMTTTALKAISHHFTGRMLTMNVLLRRPADRTDDEPRAVEGASP